MKKVTAIILSAVLLVALAGCGKGQAIAKVNGTTIYENAYTNYVDNMMLLYEINGQTLDTSEFNYLKESIVNELVNQELVLQAAKELDCMPTSSEIDAYFDEQLAALYGSAETGQSLIKQNGLELDFFRDGYTITLCQEKIQEALVPENTMTVEDAKAAYEEDKDAYNTRTVSHILIAPVSESGETDDDGNAVYTDAEWATALQEAKDIVAKLDEGEEFAALAQENSDDTNTASNGGALSEPFTKAESPYVQEFTTAAFKLTKAGEYTKEPVKSEYGYHIIKADGVLDGEIDLDAVIAAIQEESLTEERSVAYEEYMTDFRAKSNIEYYAIEKETEAPAEDEATSGDGTTDDGATDDGSTDDGSTDDGTTDDGATDNDADDDADKQ